MELDNRNSMLNSYGRRVQHNEVSPLLLDAPIVECVGQRQIQVQI